MLGWFRSSSVFLCLLSVGGESSLLCCWILFCFVIRYLDVVGYMPATTAWPRQISGQMLSSHSIVSSSTTVRPCSLWGGRWVGHWRTTWSTVCSSAPHSQAAEEAIPHLYKQERKRPTPVRRRLIRTHDVLGRVTPGGRVLWSCSDLLCKVILGFWLISRKCMGCISDAPWAHAWLRFSQPHIRNTVQSRFGVGLQFWIASELKQVLKVKLKFVLEIKCQGGFWKIPLTLLR